MNVYSLKQALEVFKKDLPTPLLPFDLPQIADLCRQGKLTPVFPYQGFISVPVDYEDTGRPIHAAGTIEPYDSYLHSNELIQLIDGYVDKLELWTASTPQGVQDLDFYSRPMRRTDDDIEPITFMVRLENILFAADDVQNYITLQYFDDLTTPEQQRIIELERELADLKNQSNQEADNTVSSLLTAIHDQNHEHHAPDLSHSIKLWSDLYIDGQIGTDSHSNKADIWINTNTGYGDNAKSSTDRIKEISSPAKHWSPHRKKEIKKEIKK